MAWSLVQQAQGAEGAVYPTPLTVTFGSPPTPGNIILISGMQLNSVSPGCGNVKDGNGVSATLLQVVPNTFGIETVQYTLVVPPTPSDSIVIGPGAPFQLGMWGCISEWSGGSDVTDGFVGTGAGAGPVVTGAGDVTTTFPDDLVWTTAAANTTPGLILDSGATLLGQVPTGDGNCFLADAYQIETVIGTYNPQWDCPHNAYYQLCNAALVAASPGSGFFPFFGD